MRRLRSKHWFWLLIPVAVGVTIASYRASIQRKLGRALGEIKTAGYPITLASLNRYYLFVPANENAAFKFTENFRGLRSVGNDTNLPVAGNGTLPQLGEPLKQPMLAAMRKYVGSNRQSLDAIEESMTLSRSRYAIDLGQSDSLFLPHLAPVRSAARLLQVQAILAAEQRDNQVAAQAILNQFALANTLRGEPILISQLVRMVILRVAKSTLERVLYNVDLKPDVSDRIAEEIRKADQDLLGSFKRGIAGDRCFGIDLFQMSLSSAQRKTGGSLGKGLFPVMAARHLIGLWDADELFFLNFTRRLILTAGRPMPEALDETAALFREFEQVRAHYYISGLLLPSYENSLAKFAESLAALRCAEAGLAARRSLSSGHPDAADLVPRTTISNILDPFSGKPLLWTRNKDNVVFYSVGPDRIDNHGHRSGRNAESEREVIFEIRSGALPLPRGKEEER